MAKLSDTPIPADSETVDEGWEEVAPDSKAKPDGAAQPEAEKAADANAAKKSSNKTTPPVRPTMPTVEEDDPLVYDVDEGRPTLPMVDPLAFDKSEPDD